MYPYNDQNGLYDNVSINSDPMTIPQAAAIKVVGVGGGGCNAVDRMIAEGIQGVEFIAVNTDAQTLPHSAASTRIQIGTRLTRGLGSGGKPMIGQSAAEEDQVALARHFENTDMVFITAGMGGGTGTGAAPIIAGLAQDAQALTVGVVTLPFSFEGNHRRKVAQQGIEQLRPFVDTLIIVPNDRLLHSVVKNTPITQAFRMVDQVLLQGVQGITDLIIRPGLINVDFADVREIMASAGTAWMAIGRGNGQNCVMDAVKHALTSPLLETSIEGARGVLCNIVSRDDVGIGELQEGVALIADTVDPDANIIFGTALDPRLTTDEVQVTLIATGFQTQKPHIKKNPSYLAAASTARLEDTSDVPDVSLPDVSEPVVPSFKLQPLRAAVVGDTHSNSTDIPPFLRSRFSRQQANGKTEA